MPLALSLSSFSRRALSRSLFASGKVVAASEGRCHLILVIVRVTTPAGVSTSTLSPTLWPMRARPTGDSMEILPSSGAASALPTTVYCFLPLSSEVTVTDEPNATAP